MIGSWAGAMGQCQFMPTSFLSYAVDYNADGKADIWDTREDIFASIANYLHTVGWGSDVAIKEKALMNWNRSTYFVASVFMLAEAIK
jgi:membrane-bound lytic murein transglycosylase B